MIGLPLAMNDRQTSGKLHASTRVTLDRLTRIIQPSGKWRFVYGQRKAFLRDYEFVMLALNACELIPD
ncbi:MAG: hypothetical protein CMO80_00975 [Verrucomicrobiales bacterium]|nr:hypothetical protein [Verrucomicrobiales bacterium]